MARLMLVLGALSFAMMNVDIFRAINLPVVMLVYNYPGLSAIDLERRIVLITERAYSTTVKVLTTSSPSRRSRTREDLFPSQYRYRLGHRATDRYLAND